MPDNYTPRVKQSCESAAVPLFAMAKAIMRFGIARQQSAFHGRQSHQISPLGKLHAQTSRPAESFLSRSKREAFREDDRARLDGSYCFGSRLRISTAKSSSGV